MLRTPRPSASSYSIFFPLVAALRPLCASLHLCDFASKTLPRYWKKNVATLALSLFALLFATRAAGEDTAPAETPSPAIAEGREALKSSPQAPWYDRQKDDVREIELSNSTAQTSRSSNLNWNFNWLSYLIWTLMAIALAALAYLLIRAFILREQRLATRQGNSEELTGTQADRVEHLPVPVRRPSGDLLSEARFHYENGNFREAIVYLYSHELVELDKQQVIHLARGKTNRQYLREVKTRQRLRELLEQTMITFEDAFFGQLDIGRQRFETCWNRLSEFNSMLPGATS